MGQDLVGGRWSTNKEGLFGRREGGDGDRGWEAIDGDQKAADSVMWGKKDAKLC